MRNQWSYEYGYSDESKEEIIFSSFKYEHMKAFWHLSDQIREMRCNLKRNESNACIWHFRMKKKTKK